MENPVSVTTVLLELAISPKEVQYFRGSIIRLSNGNPLFHNHVGEKGYHYSYPLIQYKRIQGYAALVGVNEGIDALHDFFAERGPFTLQIGNRQARCESIAAQTEHIEMTCADACRYTYTIQQWLPLNQENYTVYQHAEGLVERVSMLEKILVGNILSFAKGLGYFFETPIVCQILDLEQKGTIPYKGVELMNFSARFKCNVPLPEYIGLGKSASVGNGVILKG
jgi:hypothetical protein